VSTGNGSAEVPSYPISRSTSELRRHRFHKYLVLQLVFERGIGNLSP